MTTTTRSALLLWISLAAATLAGCASSSTPDPAGSATTGVAAAEQETSSSATLRPGDDVPAPTGKVVLVIRGGTTTNVGDELRLDLAQLEAMGTTTLEVDDDEATGRRVEFSGPLVRTVLAVAGAEGGTIHATALNDYSVDIPTSDADDLPLLLATRMDGEKMTVANYGPTRFVYPTDGYDLDAATYGPRWIWQLRTLTVR